MPYNKEFTEKAKELRKHMTPEESKLWYQFLRNLPVRFSRQKQVGDYILDFYCAKAKLCVEIDGNHHLSVADTEHDNMRNWKLSEYGITTIRFTNDQVKNEFAYVCSQIENKVKHLIQQE